MRSRIPKASPALAPPDIPLEAAAVGLALALALALALWLAADPWVFDGEALTTGADVTWEI